MINTEFGPTSYAITMKNRRQLHNRLAMTPRVKTVSVPNAKLLLKIGHGEYFSSTRVLVVGCLIMNDAIIRPRIFYLSLSFEFETSVKNRLITRTEVFYDEQIWIRRIVPFKTFPMLESMVCDFSVCKSYDSVERLV